MPGIIEELQIDHLVSQIRELAQLARSSQETWNLAYTVWDEGEEAESTPPDDERAVLVFLNGHVTIHDGEGRRGGGWGTRLGYYDHDKNNWRVGGRVESFVTHWTDLPAKPPLSKESSNG